MENNKKFEIIKFAGDLYGENTYLCIHLETNEAILIDPGTLAVNTYLINNESIKLIGVLLTHGHSDHIIHTDFYVNKYDVPLYMHQKESFKLLDAEMNLSVMSVAFVIQTRPIEFTGKSGIFTVGPFHIEFSLAAGHSEGMVIYHIEDTNIYFVGDTVFEDSIGRYDLPGSDARAHFDTLNNMVLLPETSKFYSGHGKVFHKSDLKTNAVFQMFIKLGV